MLQFSSALGYDFSGVMCQPVSGSTALFTVEEGSCKATEIRARIRATHSVKISRSMSANACEVQCWLPIRKQISQAASRSKCLL